MWFVYLCVIFVILDVDMVLIIVEIYFGCEFFGIFFIFINIFFILIWGVFFVEKNKNIIKNINMK